MRSRPGEAGIGKFELLPVEPGFGLTRLPEPSDGDIFLDLEGDPFVGEHGLEYLFGYVFKDATRRSSSTSGDWAFTRADEKRAFEKFVDFVMARWEQFPELHIYHYAPYEPAALKRLMGRYATREEEIDRMLRAGLVRRSLSGRAARVCAPASKATRSSGLEPFYGFERADAACRCERRRSPISRPISSSSDAPSISDEMQGHRCAPTTRMTAAPPRLCATGSKRSGRS